ncbi:hypothetical protein [Neobacillus cucumis]|uniref:hypothetical protein n=1 Tax=Neobacillus cucumis TaxID=1740721 RepID=UPI002E2407B4|nr:hypothetical protein [Neobacillus cucumis]
MAYTAKEAVEELTLDQLEKIVKVIEDKTFVTDEDRDSNGNQLVSKSMIKGASSYLIERINKETNFKSELDTTCSSGSYEVAAVFDCKVYEDETEFKKLTLTPYVEELKKLDQEN